MIRQSYQLPNLPPPNAAEVETPKGAGRYLVRLYKALHKILTDLGARMTTLAEGGMRDRLYPTGSVYEMVNGKNPRDAIGGSWEVLEAGEKSTKWRRV